MSFKKTFQILMLFWITCYNPQASASNLRDVAILIPSCDKYAELWQPHFSFLFKHWPSLKEVPIFLVANRKSYPDPRVTMFMIYPEISWSDNMLAALAQIKTKYVLILLDDYILTKDVDETRLNAIIDLMNQTNAAYTGLALDPKLSDGRKPAGLPGVVIKNSTDPYRASLQTSIWNKEELQAILKPGEGIWQFEELSGNIRSKSCSKPYYLVSADPVFSYLNAVTKGLYRKSVVYYINASGLRFQPKQFPVVDDYILNHGKLLRLRKKIQLYFDY